MIRTSCLSFHPLVVSALVLGLTLSPSVVRAQSVDVCINEMSDDDLERNTNRIIREFQDHGTHARAWRFGWLAAYTGIAVGASLLAVSADQSTEAGSARRLGYIGAASGAAYAAARLAFYPMPDVWGARRIERMPNGTREERIARLRYADDVMRRAGTWQHLMTGLTSWGISIGWGLGWGGAVARQYDQPVSSLTAFLGAPILGITTILTAPNWAEKWHASWVSSVCTGVYYENVEDPLGGAGSDEEIEDDWEPPVDLDDEPPLEDELPTAEAEPEVSFFPTVGGAYLIVAFH